MTFVLMHPLRNSDAVLPGIRSPTIGVAPNPFAVFPLGPLAKFAVL